LLFSGLSLFNQADHLVRHLVGWGFGVSPVSPVGDGVGTPLLTLPGDGVGVSAPLLLGDGVGVTLIWGVGEFVLKPSLPTDLVGTKKTKKLIVNKDDNNDKIKFIYDIVTFWIYMFVYLFDCV
jgi:hypothetical protein